MTGEIPVGESVDGVAGTHVLLEPGCPPLAVAGNLRQPLTVFRVLLQRVDPAELDLVERVLLLRAVRWTVQIRRLDLRNYLDRETMVD